MLRNPAGDAVSRYLAPNRKDNDPGYAVYRAFELFLTQSAIEIALDPKNFPGRYIHFDSAGATSRDFILIAFDSPNNGYVPLYAGETMHVEPANFSRLFIKAVLEFGDNVSSSPTFAGILIVSMQPMKDTNSQHPDNAAYFRRGSFQQSVTKIVGLPDTDSAWGANTGGSGIFAYDLTITAGPAAAITSLDLEVNNQGPGSVYASTIATLTNPTTLPGKTGYLTIPAGATRLLKSGAVPRSVNTITNTTLSQGWTLYSANGQQTLELLTTQYR
jgi:hypothetical protein